MKATTRNLAALGRAARTALVAALAALVPGGAAVAAGESYHELTLRKALPGGQDLVLMVGVADGRVREHALAVVGDPYTACRLKEHGLAIADGRLRGPMRMTIGTTVEKVRLDAALDKGGTYAIAGGVRSVEGGVRCQAPAGGEGPEWAVFLESMMGADRPIVLRFEFDRQGKTFTALPAQGYNSAKHTVDAGKLTFDGTNLEGEVALTITPDAWLPPDKKPLPARVRLTASLDRKGAAGRYSAVLGVASERQGEVAAAPGSRERLRDLSAPVLSPQAPWRAYLVMGPSLEKVGAAVCIADRRGKKEVFDPASADAAVAGFSPLPVAGWAKVDFDASFWPRYLPSDLQDSLGGYGVPAAAWTRAWPALLCLRTRFGVADPARAADLKVTVTCLGGAVVYVNGREVGRGFLPGGDLHPLTPAEPYPIEAYTIGDGVTPLPAITGRNKGNERAEADPQDLARYEKRVRRFTVGVPAESLVKGANVLAVEVHQAPVAGPMGRGNWAHLGFHAVTVTSASGAGVTAYREAAERTRLWSANPEDQIADTPSAESLILRREGRLVQWMRGKALRGIQSGNPFDPVLPVRMAVPRGGVASGLTAVTDLSGLHGVSARMGPLKGPGGEVPASGVQVRYAVQHPGVHYCDALMPDPPDGAATVPVWVIVEAPKGQPPGWYVGRLDLTANGKDFAVPVQVLVTGHTMPEARDWAPDIGAASSPDTIALYYSVKPWSDEHFRLMGPSLRMLGQLGNDVLRVPVILGGMTPAARDWATRGSRGARWQPLVRWVKEGDRFKPEFSLLEKFLDAYLKYCAPPKALSLYVWDSGCSKEVSDAYEGRRVAGRPLEQKSPLLVLAWDPKTGETSDLQAPNFGDPGAEAFWKPLFEGVRAMVKRRGWPERIILANLGGDLRPSQRSGERVREWAPYVRWDILSHFSGDPGPKPDGRLFATGDLEVGLKGYPWRAFIHAFTAAEFEKDLAAPSPYLDLPTARWHWKDDSPPFLFRTLAMVWGSLGQLGLDFWPGVRGAPGNTSFFTDSRALTVPGPDGAVPTVRFQMLREGVQDMALRLALIGAYQQLPEGERQPHRDLLDEFPRRALWGIGYLSQLELGYDWRAYAAGVQSAAAELAGAKSDAAWDRPPR